MSNEHNIDKLLKESFDNFSPEAPDVWQAVQQGVQAAQASAAASSGAGAAVQGVSVAVKIVAGIAIAAASVTGYLLYNSQVNKETAKVVEPVATAQVLNTPEPLAENEPPIKEDRITAVPSTTNTKTVKPPVSSTPSTQQNEYTDGEHTTTTSSVSIPETTVPDIKGNESDNTPVMKETVKTEAPKNITKVETNETGKGDVLKLTDKVSKEKPYNPYAEEGEVYEKPTVPNVFTPNDDGTNDKFKIIIENETYYSLRIINEKGETVYESRNKEQLWDGKHYKTGQQCQAGNYIYVLNYQYKGSEKVHESSGLVKLIF